MKESTTTRRVSWHGAMPVVTVLAAAAWLGPAAGAQTVDARFVVVCVADRDAPDPTKGKACLHSTPRVSFGDEVTLAVEHGAEVDFDDEAQPNPARLVLFLEGKALPGTHARVGRGRMDKDGVTTTLLTYRIERDLTGEKGRANWKEVLVAAQNRRRLTVSTGLEDGAAARSDADVEFVVLRTDRLVVWFILAIVGAFIFSLIAARTGALRDDEPLGGGVTRATEGAYSLARVQMALWTVLALYAYLFVWFLTGEYKGTIPASVVTLMGIALATYGTAAAVDSSKVRTNKEKLEELKPKLAAAPGNAQLQAEVKKVEARTEVCPSEGFFQDITTSADGASLHRLQFIVWTLALAVVFVATVWKTLAMPDFDATLLGLMGISSGTYVGLKLPEAKV